MPLPVALAVIFNNGKNGMFKKSVQLAAYALNFISVVVIVGIMKIMLRRIPVSLMCWRKGIFFPCGGR